MSTLKIDRDILICFMGFIFIIYLAFLYFKLTMDAIREIRKESLLYLPGDTIRIGGESKYSTYRLVTWSRKGFRYAQNGNRYYSVNPTPITGNEWESWNNLLENVSYNKRKLLNN
jgi:hypothetical protein